MHGLCWFVVLCHGLCGVVYGDNVFCDDIEGVWCECSMYEVCMWCGWCMYACMYVCMCEVCMWCGWCVVVLCEHVVCICMHVCMCVCM